jgi:hypothetical protein
MGTNDRTCCSCGHVGPTVDATQLLCNGCFLELASGLTLAAFVLEGYAEWSLELDQRTSGRQFDDADVILYPDDEPPTAA